MGACLKKSLTVALACFFCTGFLAAQDPSSADAANRETAIQCLEQCKTFSSRSQWQQTYQWAELGIQYDPAIPDLWYMYALAASSLGKPKAEVLSYVETALSDGTWIQYNKNAARLLYADLLSDTLEWQKALSVLSAQPSLYTADAEYIRAKTWYRLGNPARARATIRTAVVLFPYDVRFPLLFFKTEQNMKPDQAGLELAAMLISTIDIWQQTAPEITLYAAPFIPWAEERNRFVQAFNARGLTSQLYPVLALDYGIISEKTAFDYIKNIGASQPLDFDLFCEFTGYIETNEMRTSIQEWLAAFSGQFIFDTNKDGIYDLFAEYTRGRASIVRYEKQQNGINTWQALCDYGVPIKITVENSEVVYGNYPAVRSVFLTKQTGTEQYQLNADALRWTPFVMTAVQTAPLMDSFYIPVPEKTFTGITERSLIALSGVIQVPITERLEATVRFALLNGRPVSAVYTSRGQPYAFASFENGIPKFRNVDADGNGFYEITEIFAFDSIQYMHYQTPQEREKLDTILFGPIPAAAGLYLAKITADLTGNGSIDYETTMLPYGGYVSRWRSADGTSWNIGYTKRAQLSEAGIFTGKYEEESFFINPITREEVLVSFVEGIPVSVKTIRGKKEITKDALYDLYWLGEKADAQTAKIIVQTLNLYTSPAVSIIENYGTSSRILAVALGSLYFGEIF